jgi:hypothetical protein
MPSSLVDTSPSSYRQFLVQAGYAITLVSMVCAFLSFYLSNTPLRLASIAFGTVLYIGMFAASRNTPLKTASIILFAISVPFAIANAWVSDFKSLVVPFAFLSSLAGAWYALEYRKTRTLFEFAFWLYLAMTMYLIVIRGFGPDDFDDFFSGIGRNGYSAILVAAACGYIVSREVRHLPSSPVLMGAALVASIFLYGRSSIASLAAIFAVVALNRAPRISTIVIVAAICFVLFDFAEIQSLNQLDTNFKSGVESERWDMIDEYRRALDGHTFVSGVSLATLPTVVAYDGNPHNAFLRLHSYLGISALIFILIFIWSVVRLAGEKRLLLLTVLVAVLFRAFTDIILIFGTADLFFMPLLLYPFFEFYWPQHLSTASLPGSKLMEA